MAPFKLQQPKNRELLGGDLAAQSLKNLGVDVAFGLHGGHLDAFLVGATDASGKSIFAGGRTFTGFSNAEEELAGKVKVTQIIALECFSSEYADAETLLSFAVYIGNPLPARE